MALSSLILSSCNQEKDINETINDSNEYVELKLSVQSETTSNEENARALYHLNNLGKPTYTFSNPVDPSATTMSVRTYVFKGEEEIYGDVLNWTIDNAGKRLTYSGPIKIKAEKLKDASTQGLKLVAIVGESYTYKVLEFTNGNEKYDIPTPFVMKTDVKQIENKLVLSNPAQAKFKPQGVLAKLTFINNMAVPTFSDRLVFNEVMHGIGITNKGELDTSKVGINSYQNDRYEDINGKHFTETLIVLKPKQKKDNLFIWLPTLYANKLPKITAEGPAYSTGTPNKTSFQDGDLITYTFTVNEGNSSNLPYGIYVSDQNVAQVYIDTETNLFQYGKSEVASVYPEANRAVRSYRSGLYLGEKEQLFAFTTPNLNGLSPKPGTFYDTTDPSSGYSFRYAVDTKKERRENFDFTTGTMIEREVDVTTRIYSANKTRKILIRLSQDESHPFVFSYPEGMPYLLEFLPYDENNLDASLTKEYWDQRKTQISKVKFFMYSQRAYVADRGSIHPSRELSTGASYSGSTINDFIWTNGIQQGIAALKNENLFHFDFTRSFLIFTRPTL